MPEREVELSAKLKQDDKGEWRLALRSHDPVGVKALRDLITSDNYFQDHSKKLILAQSTASHDGDQSTAVEFHIYTGPDITGTEEEMEELYLLNEKDLDLLRNRRNSREQRRRGSDAVINNDTIQLP